MVKLQFSTTSQWSFPFIKLGSLKNSPPLYESLVPNTSSFRNCTDENYQICFDNPDEHKTIFGKILSFQTNDRQGKAQILKTVCALLSIIKLQQWKKHHKPRTKGIQQFEGKSSPFQKLKFFPTENINLCILRL